MTNVKNEDGYIKRFGKSAYDKFIGSMLLFHDSNELCMHTYAESPEGTFVALRGVTSTDTLSDGIFGSLATGCGRWKFDIQIMDDGTTVKVNALEPCLPYQSYDANSPNKLMATNLLTEQYGFDVLRLKTLYHLTSGEFTDYLNHTKRKRKDCEKQRKFESSIIDNGWTIKPDNYRWLGYATRTICYDKSMRELHCKVNEHGLAEETRKVSIIWPQVIPKVVLNIP